MGRMLEDIHISKLYLLYLERTGEDDFQASIS